MWRRLVGTITSHPDLVAVLAIGLVAAILRLAFLYRAPVFLTGDSQSHYLPGYDLALGLGFDPELRRTPGYPVFVAGVITFLGEDLRALAFAQHLLGTATALLTYWLGRVTFGRPAGAVAGLLVALNGALILSEHSVMTEALFGTLLVAALAALTVAVRGGRWPWFLLGGCLLGLAALTRPVAQILLPLVPLVVFALERRWRPALRASILVGLGFLLLVGPWMARNLIEHGSLTAAGGLGRSLVARTVKYDFGYFQEDRPAADPDDLAGRAWQFIRGKRNTIRNSRSVRSTQAGLMEELNLTQAQSDQLMRQAALEEIAARPAYYVVGSLRMAGQIAVGKEKEDALLTRWTQRTDKDWVEQWEARVDHLVAPDSPAEERERARAEALVGVFQPAAFGPILPALALIGLLAAVTLAWARAALLPGLAALALILASAALDGPVPRYRYPVDPLIALLAAGGTLVALGGLAAALRRFAMPRPRRSRLGPRDPRYAGELKA
jgi:4-amino-4-deoxy-L-arabinose transferase-like glycosyltransferase